MKEINLEELFNVMFEGYCEEVFDARYSIMNFAKEACRQTLELAAENSEFYSFETPKELQNIKEINRRSILDTINQIK